MAIFDKINPMQKKAIEHIEGPLLVLAGAGSGKTRIVTHRIAYLLSLGVPSSEILAVTFTNKAASEMKDRIQALSSQFVLTSTFHSLGARILRESIHHLGFENNFVIYDEDDVYKLLKECLKTIDIKDEKTLLKSLRQCISHAKNSLISPDELKQNSFESQDILILKDVYKLYEQKLKTNNALDFDDLLYKTVKLFRSNEDVLTSYQHRWKFILVDEYQDTNTCQYVLIRLLSHLHKNLFVVGDPDQSIYSWRGANINNILNFESDFESTKVIKLEQNYRSTSNILSAANSLIENNHSRYKKDLWSDLGSGEKVCLNIVENEREEVAYVVSKILKHLGDGFSLNDIVIFYRTNAQSRAYEDSLLRENIPYKIIGGLSFYQRKEIKDILAYLKCAFYESDFISFSRVINVPKKGLGPSFIQKIKELSEKTLEPILKVCFNLSSNPFAYPVKFSAKQLSSLASFVQTIKLIQQEKENAISNLLTRIIHSSGYLQSLKEDKETFEDRKENLEELVSKAAAWELDNPEKSIQDFLEELTLYSATDDSSNAADCIKLMTLHNGKGLEFEVCFIVGLEEDLLPHINSKNDENAIEEERRLFYVGMTRAKKHLYLTASKYRFFWGSPKFMTLSRFISEIDPEYIEGTTDLETNEGAYLPGSLVVHKDFGQGIIRRVYNTSLGETLEVFFQDLNEIRSLVTKYAKLSLK